MMFYARDYKEPENDQLFAFKTKSARDFYTDDDNRRFVQTYEQAQFYCKQIYCCTLKEAIEREFLKQDDAQMRVGQSN